MRNEELLTRLSCDVDYSKLPHPIPLPTRSWFKDSQLVSSTLYGVAAEIDESFLMENPILNLGVFDFLPLQILSDGDITLFNGFSNITSRELGMLSPSTTLEQAREKLFDIFLGNWTCIVNNSLGSSSVEYILRENGECMHVNHF